MPGKSARVSPDPAGLGSVWYPGEPWVQSAPVALVPDGAGEHLLLMAGAEGHDCWAKDVMPLKVACSGHIPLARAIHMAPSGVGNIFCLQ